MTARAMTVADFEAHAPGLNLWCASCARGALIEQAKVREIGRRFQPGDSKETLATILKCSHCGTRSPQIRLASPRR